METWIWLLIGGFVACDAAVTFLVLRSVRRKRARRAEDATDDLAKDIGIPG